MVVTSQIRFTMTNEKSTPKEWLSNKKKMADFTKDIMLGSLPMADAVKFLGPSSVCMYLQATRCPKSKLQALVI